MSLLIKGVKMPKGEDEGMLIAVYDGKAYITGTKETREAVDLPYHGDLIDESEKVDAQYYDEEFEEWLIKSKTVGDILSEVCEVPPKVVIPAERSEE